MNLSNWKNKRLVLQALSFTLLFQLIFPVFANSVQSSQTGYFANVCTTQGYQQIWVSSDNNHDEQYLAINCPECLLSHYEHEDKTFNVVEYYNGSNNTLFQVVSADTQSLSNFIVSVFPIRAPPSLAS